MGTLRFMGPTMLALLMAFGCGDDDGPPASDAGSATDAGGSNADGGSPGVDGGPGPATDGGVESDGGAAVDGGSPSMNSCPMGECDLLTNDGCAVGEACKFASTMMGEAPAPVCVAAGPAADGAECSGLGDCQEGLHCQDGRCRAYCCSETRTGCPTGQSCLTNLVNEMGEQTGVGLCGVPSGCDLLAQDCPEGQGCYPSSGTGDCVRPTGMNSMQGGACTATNDCAPGFACINTGGDGFCASMCDREGGDPACGAELRCVGVGGGGMSSPFPANVGVCVEAM